MGDVVWKGFSKSVADAPLPAFVLLEAQLRGQGPPAHRCELTAEEAALMDAVFGRAATAKARGRRRRKKK